MGLETFHQVRRVELKDGAAIPAGAEVLDTGIKGDTLVVWYRGPETFHLDDELDQDDEDGEPFLDPKTGRKVRLPCGDVARRGPGETTGPDGGSHE